MVAYKGSQLGGRQDTISYDRLPSLMPVLAPPAPGVRDESVGYCSSKHLAALKQTYRYIRLLPVTSRVYICPALSCYRRLAPSRPPLSLRARSPRPPRPRRADLA